MNQKVKKILFNKGALIGFILSILILSSYLFLDKFIVFLPDILGLVLTTIFAIFIVFLMGFAYFILAIIFPDLHVVSSAGSDFSVSIEFWVLAFFWLTLAGSFSYLSLKNPNWSKVKRRIIFTVIIILYLLLNFLGGFLHALSGWD